MTRRHLMILAVGAVLSVHLYAAPAAAQSGLRGRLKQRVEETVDRAIDGAIGSQTSGATAPSTSDMTGQAAATDGAVDVAAADPAAASNRPAITLKPGEGAWANYDFVPGERPVFVDDFARDRVGDFPRRLEFIEGNMEVVEWQNRRWLRATSDANFAVPLGEILPDRFTLEFDYTGINKYELKVRFHGPDWQAEEEVHVGAWGWGISGGTVKSISAPREPETVESRVVRVRVMADGSYVKVYVDGERVANVPNAKLGRADRIWFEVPAGTETPALIGDLQVMAGGRDLYDALAADGRVATQGILFDTGSDRVRPESTPTLKEIADALSSHPQLRISIEGHTDNVGDSAANQTLSEKRAFAVRQTLIDSFGVDPARLESQGFGASTPVADNESAEGRQQNRRVELVRL